MGWKVFLKNLPPHFYCLYFIGAGGDEYLKKYLVWPFCYVHMVQKSMFLIRILVHTFRKIIQQTFRTALFYPVNIIMALSTYT